MCLFTFKRKLGVKGKLIEIKIDNNLYKESRNYFLIVVCDKVFFF